MDWEVVVLVEKGVVVEEVVVAVDEADGVVVVDGVVVAEVAADVEEVSEAAAFAAVVRRLLFSKRGKGKTNKISLCNDFKKKMLCAMGLYFYQKKKCSDKN